MFTVKHSISRKELHRYEYFPLRFWLSIWPFPSRYNRIFNHHIEPSILSRRRLALLVRELLFLNCIIHLFSYIRTSGRTLHRNCVSEGQAREFRQLDPLLPIVLPCVLFVCVCVSGETVNILELGITSFH